MATTESLEGTRSTATAVSPGALTRLIGTRASRDAATSTRRVSAPGWSDRYRARLRVTDTLVVTTVVVAAMVGWEALLTGAPSWRPFLTGAVLAAGWLTAITLADTRSHRVTGAGMAEYRRLWDATLTVVATVAVIAVFVPTAGLTGALVLAMPLGFVALMVERAWWRSWLKRKRRYGRWSTRVLLVGSGSSVRNIRDEFHANPQAGFRVVGLCEPVGDGAGIAAQVRRELAATGADTVVVTGSDVLAPERVKEISWALESGHQHLMLAPSITDIAGPRIRTRPACGLPLIHVETPRLTRSARLTKRCFDIAVSLGIIVLVAPVLLAVALVVKASGPGPVLYRQQRIGLGGRTFEMLKFRTMRVGADTELAALLKAQGTCETPLFKIKDDPRITPAGRVLRKYSLDELPQLFNVLSGTMSLVGPRPQIAKEVALYSGSQRRRLLASPGITGLWQVSGRSSMDWAHAVRLDLYYVENWSLITDVVILLRTFRAVIAPGETAH